MLFRSPYYEKDGISDFTFNNFSIICNKQDEIVIGGHGGFIKIRPVFFDIYSNDRKVIFTELYLANERMDVGQKTSDGRVLISKNIQLLNEITMDYSDRNFALEVSAMDYANRHKLQYVYRFGKKEEWIKLEGNRIYFNKLSPGNHLLEVKVSELQSKNESASATLIIHVKPPFWLSNIAYCIYFILIISIIVFSIFDLRRKHKKMLIQQKRDMEIAQQHEMDEAKIRFFTNVSHDLRTPLSLIITPLERIMSTNVSRDLNKKRYGDCSAA